MNFVQQVEECLRDLAAEARKKPQQHPGVKEASERATLKLRQLQNRYIAAVRKANQVVQTQTKEKDDDDDDDGTTGDETKRKASSPSSYPTTRIFQSSELLHPFLLACNYPNASDRLLEVSFKAMKLLMENDAVVPSDGIHMVRVWTIQAHVVVTGYYALQPATSSTKTTTIHKENVKGDGSPTAPPTSASSATTSSWFSWRSGGSATDESSTTSGSSYSTSVVAKNAVSSSTGQSSTIGSSSPVQMERRAKEILSGLLQLLDLLTTKYSSVDAAVDGHCHPTREWWTNAVALGCVWLPAVPRHQTVHQAARSTVLQLLNALYAPTPAPTPSTPSSSSSSSPDPPDTNTDPTAIIAKKRDDAELVNATWHDLLVLATLGEPTNSKRLQSLKGAFMSCRKTSRSSSSAAAGLSFPPTPDFSLELMTYAWQESSGDTDGSQRQKRRRRRPTMQDDDALMERTKGVTLQLLQEMSRPHATVETTMRTLQWTLTLLSSLGGGGSDNSSSEAEECTELICQFIKPIALATEACRTQYDFEDGYTYQSPSYQDPSMSSMANAGGGSNAAPGATATGDGGSNPNSGEPLASLFPPVLLWKAGLALEATHLVLERYAQTLLVGESDVEDPSNHLLAALSECLSDFATIGASCRDHMLQLVEFAALQRDGTSHRDGSSSGGNAGGGGGGGSLQKSFSFFRRAEQAVASGNQSLFLKSIDATTIPTAMADAKGGIDSSTLVGTAAFAVSDKQRGTGLLLGEALWIALQGILRIAECMNSMKLSPQKDKQAAAVVTHRILEETFAPSLAVLQHYLKRFVGSPDLVQLSLQGYSTLANVCMSDDTVEEVVKDASSLQRKAILTSLCKLSLPSWGKHDASSLLQDHHVRCLLCLFRIVHTHYNAVSFEWDILLWTLEELSVLAIASPLLSDECYHAALAVAASLERFPAFSTCFSMPSLLRLVDALTEIAKAAMVDRDVIGDSDTVVSSKKSAATAAIAAGDSSSSDRNADGKETISEKIMNIGVRAIYGGSGSGSGAETGKAGEMPAPGRTKNTFYEDYRSDFVKRLTSTKTSIRVTAIGNMSLSLAFLVDVFMANSFRWQECGDEFSAHLSSLATASPAVRPFVMDVMSMLTMAHVSKERALPVPFAGPGRLVFADPMQSQLWAVEHVQREGKEGENTGGENEKSQSQLLAPTCHTLRTTEKAELAESALGALFSIIEGVGHQLSGDDVWSNVIDAVASLSGDPLYEIDRSSSEWSSCCLMAFRCLKFIVDDFLDQLSSSLESAVTTRTSLLDCCSSFGRSRHDVNTSLTAIGLLWTIADQDSGADSIDLALSKLVLLASDSRPEVRNAAVNTLFSCIVGRGGSFSAERWESCFSESIFGVYNLVLSKAMEGDDGIAAGKQAQKYKMSLHHSRDSSNKQWITTQVLVFRGLLRVLRSYFSQLLDSTETGELVDVPWFQDAWVKILDFAFEAASLNGGRDILDIRNIGVEVLVVCCQLTSKAGIQASAAPARVGTNMEVVNGALRSVRESQGTRSSYERSNSRATELSCQSLFLEAFEGLESYKDFLEKTISDSSAADESLLQILHKFATGLSQLYECCKDNELASNVTLRDARSFEVIGLPSEEHQQSDEDDLELRFVRIVTAVVVVSTVDPKSRFLNQGQRCSLNLLRSLASEGSMEALQQLVSLAGCTFFVKRENDIDVSESPGTDESLDALDLVSSEAATIVSEEMNKDSTRRTCKAMVLYKVLVAFSNEYGDVVSKKSSAGNRRRRYFKRMVPIITHGLAAVASLDDSEVAERATELVWANMLVVLSEMLTPVPVGKDMVKISRVSDLLEILSAARDYVPPGYRSDLSDIFSFGASKSLEVAKQHDAFAKGRGDSELGKKSKLHRDDLLKLFNLCFSSSCSLQPDNALLRSTAGQALTDAMEVNDTSTPESGNDALTLSDEAAVNVCRTITQSENIESLVVSIFSVLCNLVTSDTAALREAAGQVLAVVDVPDLLQTAHSRYQEAERRAVHAEKLVEELSGAVDELQRKNESLSREVAILEATSSSAM